MITAQPDFKSADDVLVALALTETKETQENTLYITSDKILQARLIQGNAKNIITGKTFFNVMKNDIIGRREYCAIINA